MSTIKIKRSETAAAQPASLAYGELGINITDKKIFIGNSSGATTLLVDGNATGGSTSTETIQDAAASLFTSGTHVGISVSYPDTNNAINLRNTGVLAFGFVFAKIPGKRLVYPSIFVNNWITFPISSKVDCNPVNTFNCQGKLFPLLP